MATLQIPYPLPPDARAVLEAAPRVTVASSVEELITLSTRDAVNGWHEVAYEVPGRGRVPEARVCAVKNGIAANYLEPYMRRRDPDCMVIGDARPTDKPTFHQRFGRDFGPLREETLAWLRTQNLAAFPFLAGVDGKGVDAFVIAPDNAGFFALGLSLLQGLLGPSQIPPGFAPKAVIYVAPPFRHTHFDGRQVVVHARGEDCHELFSYNLYPGPSAKKGVYGVLLNVGEAQKWVTMHGATVQVITPYGNKVVMAHEGASGGGKSELLEQPHRQRDGTSSWAATSSPAIGALSPCREAANCGPSPTIWPSVTPPSTVAPANSASSMPRRPGSSASTTSGNTAPIPIWKN